MSATLRMFFTHRGTRQGEHKLLDWESHYVCSATPAADVYFALANWLLDSKPLMEVGDTIELEQKHPTGETEYGILYDYHQ